MIGFSAEQDALASACWQLVGLRDSLERPSAWLRRTVFGRDVFVQDFAGELRGYHNVCSHRGFPLRTADGGVGPVTCGFHGWIYNRDGVPTGIPRNAELFQISRDGQRALALTPVRVESIGRFVFVCLSPAVPPLTEYLGRFADVLRNASAQLAPVLHHEVLLVAANWKRCVEITLDDYHLADVHPETFGVYAGAALHGHVYQREGIHSSYLWRRDADWSFDGFWRDLPTGAYDRAGYKIFNCFPTGILATSRTASVATSTTPLGPHQTRIDLYVFRWHEGVFTDEEVAAMVAFNVQVVREDRAACEAWEMSHDRLAHPPLLGRLEERVGWFREVYDSIVGPSEIERRDG